MKRGAVGLVDARLLALFLPATLLHFACLKTALVVRGEYLYRALGWYHTTKIDDPSLPVAPRDLVLRNSQGNIVKQVSINKGATRKLDLPWALLPSLVVLGKKTNLTIFLVARVFVLVVERPLSKLLVLEAEGDGELPSALHRNLCLRVG